jgi:hypothetical protein
MDKTFVTGNLIYKDSYNYGKDESITIQYLGKSFPVSIDQLNNDFITNMLIQCGIPANKIIAAGAFGSSSIDLVEIFFAYEGSIPQQYVDLWLINKHHKYAGYATQDGIIMPAYTQITKNLDAIATKLANDYMVKSFMIKPFSMKSLPAQILSKNPNNGVLADMRNIPGSYAYIAAFKKLNWQRLWYQDPSGKQKTEVRPQTGW